MTKTTTLLGPPGPVGIQASNHCVFAEGECVFNQTGPIIKLTQDSATEFLNGLMGILNSSVACLWMKESCRAKGGDHVGKQGARVRKTPWDERYAFSSNPMKKFPVTKTLPAHLGGRLLNVGAKLTELYRRSLTDISSDELVKMNQAFADGRGLLIALQEELDWEGYRCYGIVEDDLSYSGDDLPALQLGERAFEIALARQVAAGEVETTWFERHSSRPRIEIPSEWPEGYRQVVKRRLDAIDSNQEARVLEQPLWKRRWNTEPWEGWITQSLRERLRNRLEEQLYWDSSDGEPSLKSVSLLTDIAAGDERFLDIAAQYRGRDDYDLRTLVAELVESQSVPFLPVLRYKVSLR